MKVGKDSNNIDVPKGLDKFEGKEGKEICVACMILVQVLNSNDEAVDQVPCMVYLSTPPPLKGFDGANTADTTIESWKKKTPKLYYITDSLVVKTLPASLNTQLNYRKGCLEVPDPRFNFGAMNWISSVNGAPTSGNTQTGQQNPSTYALLAMDGRDADIFMSVADSGYMQSPGELGFILRPYPGFISYLTLNSIQSVDLDAQTQVAGMSINTDKDAMFRTYRLYDHGDYTAPDKDIKKRDDIYGNFCVIKEDGTLPGARVNPLSDMKGDEGLRLRSTAIWDTPLGYWYSSTNNPMLWDDRMERTFNRRQALFGPKDYVSQNPDGPDPAGPKWVQFRNAWATALDNAVTWGWESDPVKTYKRKNNKEDGVKVNCSWKLSLSDVYGNWDVFRWYSDNPTRKEIFGDNLGQPILTMQNTLHEVDRKMLYAHSLDAFSDRQQLFLFFLRAEATVPSFGGVSEGGMRSLAGGRAVALVWRDPYPYGYNKANDTWVKKNWYPYNGGSEAYLSPWVQYYYDVDNPQSTDDKRNKNGYRWDSYHETRILYFKQLEQ